MSTTGQHIQIEPIGLEALAQLRRISIQTFMDTYGQFNTSENVKVHIATAFNEKQLRSELQDPEVSYFFAYHTDSLVGYLKLNVGKAQTEPMASSYLEIERIYVINDFKGKGLGGLFIELAKEQAIALGKTVVWLGVWEKNPKAVAFYEHMGFEKSGTHTFTVGTEDQTDFVMTLTLLPR